MKKIMTIITLFISLNSMAQNQREFDEMYSQSYRAPGGNYNKIKVKIGVAQGKDVRAVINEVKSILGIKDPNGFFNPYWVTSFPSYGYYKNEAVIIGTWYTSNYEGYNTWYRKIEPLLNDLSLEYYKIEAIGD